MLFDAFDITGYEWILGVGLMFGLALILTLLTFKDLISFFVFLTIFNGFMVWAGLLEMWTIALNIAILIAVIILSFDEGGNI